VFTPNDDNLNDVFVPVFSPYGLDEKSYQMDIFDRWGVIIFHTFDHRKGWDGRIGNRDQVKQDVYTYRIKFKDLDGKAYTKEGTVTLIP